MIALGGNDGKIRLFDTNSFFCFQTFCEHQSRISDLKFSPKLNTLISCSLDGTVRAYDTLRYRNFRTMKADTEVQFNCLAVDPSGEVDHKSIEVDQRGRVRSL
jgi:periodic tryptophan protein 2